MSSDKVTNVKGSLERAGTFFEAHRFRLEQPGRHLSLVQGIGKASTALSSPFGLTDHGIRTH